LLGGEDSSIGDPLRGLVISSDNRPLDSVVIVSGQTVLAVTDQQGRFVIVAQDTNVELTFYRYGYEIITLSAGELEEGFPIVMQREAMALEGVTVRQRRVSVNGSPEMRTIIPIRAEMKGKELSDILKAYPEINFSGISLPGERQTISLLGHHARHTLVLLDGIPLNCAGQPYDISSIPTEIIESIEIIKGGAGAYKGSGAIGGLININTKEPVSRLEASLSQSIGSYGLLRTAGSFYMRGKHIGFSLFLDRTQAKNDFDYYYPEGDRKTREYNNKEMQNVHLRLSGHLKNVTLLYKLELFDFDHKLPGPVNLESLYRDARLEGSNLRNYLSAALQIPRINPEFIAYYHRNRTKYDNTRAPVPFFHLKSENENDRQGLQLKLSTIWGDDRAYFKNIGGESNLQLEYSREDFTYLEENNPDNSIPTIKQNNYAVAAGTDILIPLRNIDWSHNLTGRWDRYHRDNDEDKSSFSSYRYDSAFTINNPMLASGNPFDELLFFSIGTGLSRNYNIPSFYDLYWKGDSQTSGNPDLQMEKSHNFLLFAEFSLFNLTPRIEYHKSRINNLIYWYRSNTGWKPGNIASAEISNLQVTANFFLNDLLSLSASWLKTDAYNKSLQSDGSPGDLYNKKLIYTPDESFTAELTLWYAPFYWRVTHSHTGIQWSTPDQLIPPLQSYQLTDTELGVNFRFLALNWQCALTLKNIFDKHYEIYAYTPQPGFNWVFNLKLNHSGSSKTDGSNL